MKDQLVQAVVDKLTEQCSPEELVTARKVVGIVYDVLFGGETDTTQSGGTTEVHQCSTD